MKMKVQIVIESDEGEELIQDIASLARGPLSVGTLGLRLTEGKEVLQSIQHALVTQQLLGYLERERLCPHCGRARSYKGHHTIVFRTLFGKLSMPSPRLYVCGCEEVPSRSFSPLAGLLSERTAPELAYLEAKWASLMSYGLTVDLLNEVLPLAGQVNTTSVIPLRKNRLSNQSSDTHFSREAETVRMSPTSSAISTMQLGKKTRFRSSTGTPRDFPSNALVTSSDGFPSASRAIRACEDGDINLAE